MYISLGVTVTMLALCGYAWHTVQHPHAYIWPLWILRLVMFACLEVTYVGVLNVFFPALDCQWVSEDTQRQYYNRDFPFVGEDLYPKPPSSHPVEIAWVPSCTISAPFDAVPCTY